MTDTKTRVQIEQVDEWRWRIPAVGAMRVPGLIFASSELMKSIMLDKAIDQVVNVAQLPGIVGNSIAMPDIHWGYGFPIGGVAAFDLDTGVISPGGVGYDINCGVRLLATPLHRSELSPKTLTQLVQELFATIPTGVGKGRKDIKLSNNELRHVAHSGVPRMISKGYGVTSDLDHIESGGCIPGADPDSVSERAYARGVDQLGTLGSGNHFCEVQVVDTIYDSIAAEAFGLASGSVVVLIHTGSRGYGYQVCEDAIEVMLDAAHKYRIALPDKQLCCVPLSSPEARNYMSAMACAANFAFANRQLITHKIRDVFSKIFGQKAPPDSIRVVYDVAHNIAKIEDHVVGGKQKRVCVHRKGATRSLPADHKDTPEAYKHVGQPVIVPGDMGRASYVLVGQPGATHESFGSCCHGAGRAMSRHEALKNARKRNVERELFDRGIVVMASGRGTLAEEMPDAYKDVSAVVSVVHNANLATRVAKLRPVGCIKG